MPALRRAVAAVSVAGVVLLAGCTGSDRPTADPTPDPTSPAATETAQVPSTPSDPGDEPADPAEPTGAAAPTQAPGDDRGTVTPFITYAGPGTDPGTIEVAGFIPEIIEEGGTCTATIPTTGMAVEAPAFPDASSTSCGLMVLPTPPDGQTVVLTYSSGASAGLSSAVRVTS